MNEEYIYLSYFMDENTPLYGGNRGIAVKPDRSIKEGDTANTKHLYLHNHSGTHIDYPNHFFDDGITSEKYVAAEWMFHAPFLIEVRAEQDEIIGLTSEQLNQIPQHTDFLIIKTGFGKYRQEDLYWKHNPGLSPMMADQLRTRLPFLRVIGVDIVSITSFQKRELGREAHRNFLGGDHPILLVEDMNLSDLYHPPKVIMCFPLMLRGVDGAPVTIIAK